MTELLEQAIERLRTLPPDSQDDLARLLLRLSGEGEAVYRLSAEEEADLIEADDEVRRGDLATDSEVALTFDRHGR